MAKRVSADCENVTDDKRSASAPLPQRRWWKRRLVVASVLVASIWFCRDFILCGVGGLLVLDESDGEFNAVVILDMSSGGSDRYVEAAALYRADPARQVLLFESYRSPLVCIGAIPARDVVGRRQLADRGVPTEDIELIAGAPRGAWEAAHCLQAWLKDRGDARPLILCHRFHSRCLRHVLDEVLEEDAARVFVRALPGDRADETNWWKSRDGVKDVFFGYFRLAYVWCMGQREAVSERVHIEDKPEASRGTFEEARS
ncbi:MAG: hypothetical protein HQ567_32260 [Candidatus Nealsonbacteria bacterium]|nr:hypothetical protein [Candidatus Nealsonbacteria bacterium]